ncbi:Carbon-nitrogen hydrolase, partial [Ascosphaera atra]
MRIATLQFAPAVGAVDENIRRADELLAELQEKVRRFDRQLDLLVLPEMALTGYNFPSAEAITPCLETIGEGPSATWAAKAANKLNCAVCVGYPEAVSDTNEEG